MLKQIEGSQAVAAAVAMCRPEVICAYPITPQTHIVEALSAMVKRGDLNAEFLNVESEFAAMSVAIGASATGARAYTATASQGLLYMSEAVYNAAGLGLPIVMTVANRAIGAPINIWNDHSDAMSQRDAGWIQLYAETNQEALDLHIQAFRIAEGAVGAGHGVHGRLPAHPRQRAGRHARPRPRWTRSCRGTTRARCSTRPSRSRSAPWSAPRRSPRSATWPTSGCSRPSAVIPAVAAEFAAEFGRTSGGLVRPYLTEDAEIVMVALGSVLGTVKDVVDELRADGMKVGVLGITSFRPFPAGRGPRSARPGQPAPGRAGAGARPGHRRHRDRRRALAAGRRNSPRTDLDRGRRPRRPRDHQQVAARHAAAGAAAASSGRSASSTWTPGLVRTGTGPDARRAPVRPEPRRTCCATSAPPPHGSDEHHAIPADQVLPDRQLRGREPAAGRRAAQPSSPRPSAPTR